MKKRIMRILCLIGAMLIITTSALADAASTPEPQPTPAATAQTDADADADAANEAAVETEAATDAETETTVEDGTVRVLLTYPGTDLTSVDIELDGSYSINGNSGFRFERGSKLYVFVSDGEPVLTYEGMTMHMGAGFELTRHQVAGDSENGLHIGDVSGLYEGDLKISVVDGALRMVLSIYIEDYLKGVVPYEMSDSYPIEALKAQAVAARTYALKRRSESRDYDVYDNTNDQVFRGYEAQYTNAAQAVEDTCGIVGTYNGELAVCFYSASNGGQTELYKNVYGDEGDYGYLTMRNDPYDLGNDQSRVKYASVPKEPGTGSELPETLDELLKAALEEQLTELGYDGAADNITIVEVVSITPHTPKYDVPSRVFTKMRFKLRVMARKVLPQATADLSVTADPNATADPSATEQPTLSDMRLVSQEFTVDLDIFGGVESALGLSINKLENELITVRDDGDKFVIESRRFGHGLGLSQRGAQRMAGTYSWTYDQILAFYYPGLDFNTHQYAQSILPEITEEVAATPRPTAEPTPAPTYVPVGDLPDGAFYAEVALGSDASTLNLRAEPSTESQIIYTLTNGQPVIVLSDLGTGWVEISVGTMHGYVAAQYIRLL